MSGRWKFENAPLCAQTMPFARFPGRLELVFPVGSDLTPLPALPVGSDRSRLGLDIALWPRRYMNIVPRVLAGFSDSGKKGSKLAYQSLFWLGSPNK